MLFYRYTFCQSQDSRIMYLAHHRHHSLTIENKAMLIPSDRLLRNLCLGIYRANCHHRHDCQKWFSLHFHQRIFNYLFAKIRIFGKCNHRILYKNHRFPSFSSFFPSFTSFFPSKHFIPMTFLHFTVFYFYRHFPHKERFLT